MAPSFTGRALFQNLSVAPFGGHRLDRHDRLLLAPASQHLYIRYSRLCNQVTGQINRSRTHAE
jgi:hypothetical protein